MVNRRGLRRLVVVGSLFVVLGGLAVALRISQLNSREKLEQRFSARAELAASFVSTYVGQLFERQRVLSERNLAQPAGLREPFEAQAGGFGFPAAVLTDGRGKLMEAVPSDPTLIGQDLANRYAHIRTALGGLPAVSKVVPSAVTGTPVVAFATPFDTPSGRRVFSGAYNVTDTPLGAFINDAVPIPGVTLYLVDADWTIIASNRTPRLPIGSLPEDDPALARAASASAEGHYDAGTGRSFYARRPVGDTGWRLVVAAPDKRLFAPVSGTASTLPWVVLGGLTGAALLACWFGIRYVEGRNQLADLNVHLDRVSRLDELTALPNRRHLTEHLAASVSAAKRHESWLSVLIVDIDHFKRVNDTFGHAAGDVVLRHVADVLSANVRTEDIVGRWGGEEFLAVLPQTDLEGARLVAARAKAAVGDSVFPVGSGGDEIRVTVSIGCTATLDESTEALFARADSALYRAKEAGRDRIECIPAVTAI